MSATPVTPFETNNQAYLKAGLTWLRAAIEARLVPLPATAEPDAPRPVGLWSLGRKKAPDTLLLSASPGAATPDAAREAFDLAAASEPRPALVALAMRLGLSSFEADVLWLTAALEIDPQLPDLIAALSAPSATRAPTFALAMSLFEDSRWDALSPHRPLRALRLVEVHQAGATSLINAPLRIDERIGAFVKGLNYLDDRLAAQCSTVEEPGPLPPSQQAAADLVARWLQRPLPGHLVQLTGGDEASRRDVAATAAAASGRLLLALDASAVPTAADDADQFVQLWSRETSLLPLVLLVDGADGHAGFGEDTRTDPDGRRRRLLQRAGAPVLLSCGEATTGVAQSVVVRVEPPSTTEREALWREGLAIDAGRGAIRIDTKGKPAEIDAKRQPLDDAVRRLADEFALGASRIRALASAAHAMATNADEAVETAWNACIENTAGALDGLAQRIAPRATLDELRLPASEKAELERLIAHARHRAAAIAEYGFDVRGERGLGIAALFHGESGAGKTMAAEVVADALHLALFRVDLSALISKYIGETAKNLRRVFDAAEEGGAVLLFDEADAIFGKRAEAKDSIEQHNNMDIGYLLSRVERFRGVVVLATNMKHALDPAFTRRLRFVIGFPFPSAVERRAIWGGVFPRADRVAADVDLDRLSRFVLTGGQIFNAALGAAHAAASRSADGSADIAMRDVLDAVKGELRKLDRPVPDAQFADVPGPVAAVEREAA